MPSPRLDWAKRAINALLNALVFSLFLSLFLSLLRGGFIAYSGIYQGALAPPLPLDQIAQVLKDGFKYDNHMAAAFSLIFLPIALVRSRLAYFYALFVLALCLALQVANITYYEIYGGVFDTNLLDAFNQTPQNFNGHGIA